MTKYIKRKMSKHKSKKYIKKSIYEDNNNLEFNSLFSPR